MSVLQQQDPGAMGGMLGAMEPAAMGPARGGPGGFMPEVLSRLPEPLRGPAAGGGMPPSGAKNPLMSMLPGLAPGMMGSMQQGNFNPLMQQLIMRALSGGM